ncbi:GMC family oxidoreductase, partial [archaeon]
MGKQGSLVLRASRFVAQAKIVMSRKRHIIVGAGTSGVILAKFLADAGHDVVLIEEELEEDVKSTQKSTSNDGVSKLFNLHSAAETWTYQCYNPKHANFIKSIAQEQLGGRQIIYPRGKGLGGTSNINAMIFFRGHNEVYDQLWPKSWSSSFVSKLEVEVLRLIDFGKVQTSGAMGDLISSATCLLTEESKDKDNLQNGLDHSSSSGSNTGLPLLPMHYTTYTTKHQSTMDSCQTKRRKLEEVLFPHTPKRENEDNHQDNNAAQTSGSISIVKGRVLYVNIVNYVAVSVTVDLLSGLVDEIHVDHGGEIVLCAGVFITAPLLIRSIQMARPAFAQGESPVRDFERGEEVHLPLYDHTILPCIWWGDWKE